MESKVPDDVQGNNSHELKRALKKFEQRLKRGLRHGFFKCTVTCDVVKDKKRRLTFEAGEVDRYFIGREELTDR